MRNFNGAHTAQLIKCQDFTSTENVYSFRLMDIIIKIFKIDLFAMSDIGIKIKPEYVMSYG